MIASEKAKLEDEQKIQVDSLRKKHDSEIERLRQELERRHKERQDSLRSELAETHKQVGVELFTCLHYKLRGS